MHRLEALLCATLVWLAPIAAAAEPTLADRNAARALASDGADLFDANKHAEAIEVFRKAEALVHAPTHLLYIARAHQKLGKLVEAHDVYDDILTDPFITPTSPSAFRDARTSAEQEDAALLARIPTMKLVISSPAPETVQVTMDGKRIERELLLAPLLMNPGSHKLEAQGRGLVSDAKTVAMSEGDRINVTLSLPWQGPLYPAIVALSAGALGLTIGTVTGILSVSKVGDLEDRCPEMHCLPPDRSIGDSAKTLGTVSTVSFVLGGALIGAGVALAIVRPGGGPPDTPNEHGPWVRTRLGLGAAAIEGAF